MAFFQNHFCPHIYVLISSMIYKTTILTLISPYQASKWHIYHFHHFSVTLPCFPTFYSQLHNSIVYYVHRLVRRSVLHLPCWLVRSLSLTPNRDFRTFSFYRSETRREASTVPDPLKGTKSTGLRPRALGGLAPRSSAGAPLRFWAEGKGKTKKEGEK